MKDYLKLLEEPGAAYRGKPFWSWNGDLQEEELLAQIDALKEMGFGGYFMHSRTGLITEYMGKKWFSLVRACAKYGAEQGMESWIYDEDRWPSGSCGGMVTKDKRYRMRYISEYSSDGEAVACADVIGILARYAVKLENGCLKDAFEVESEAEVPAGYTYKVYAEELMRESNFYNGAAYLDTMDEEAVRAFLHSTLDAYAKECGDMFGKEIAGVFTDEPNRGSLFSTFGCSNANAKNMIPYTHDLFSAFEKKYGRKLNIPAVYYLSGKDNEEAARYIDVADDLFCSAFAKQYGEWCEKHGIILTGHILHEDSLTVQSELSGSMMRFYEYMGYPGIDNLSAHNGCYWAAIQCASVARQMGKKFVLSELYGCTGWDMPLSEYKRIGDWHVLFGVNLRCPHLSWYSMKGEAKRDYPASILSQNSWYRDWKPLEDHFARVGMIMTEGTRKCDLLVIHPVENMWLRVHKGWVDGLSPAEEQVAKLDAAFIEQCRQIIRSQHEFDYGDEELLKKYARVEKDGQGALFVVGQARYRTLLVAEGQRVRPETQALIEKFCAQGGKVVHRASELPAADVYSAPEGVATAVREWMGERWLFAVNLEERRAASGDIRLAGGGAFAEEWDFSVLKKMGNVSLKNMQFARGQMRIFRLTGAKEATKTAAGEPVALPEKMRYTLTEPNVLVLDYAACELDGKPFCEKREVLKVDRSLRTHFGMTLRGGEMVQPWFAAKFGKDADASRGKVKLTYTFRSERAYAVRIAAEYERMTLNGEPLRQAGGRWVDNCFRLFEGKVQAGENILCTELDFCVSANIEAVYVLGDFGVKLPNTLCDLPETLSPAEVGAQGLPFYSGGITFETGLSGAFRVCIRQLHGATLHLLGEKDELVAFPPYTGEVRAENLKLRVYFTRRNTFGPLHFTPQPQEAYGPEHFVSEGANWTDDYMLIPSGFTADVYKL